MKNSSKTNRQSTTSFLAVILLLLILAFLAVCFINRNKYRIYGGMTAELKDSDLFEDLSSGRSVCFLGDSITAGNEINGICWYEPLTPYIKGNTSNISRGGWMVENLIEQGENIPEADIYIIAIGINDIIFRDGVKASATPEDFAQKCSLLAETIKGISPDAIIYFIAPWSFTGQDETINNLGISFRNALQEMCTGSGYQYINPDPIIISVFNEEGAGKYMHNTLHPNAPQGVGLYSYAVLKAAHEQRAAS